MLDSHSLLIALSKEFLLFRRRFTAGDVSCSKSLPLRGRLVPFEAGLEEHFKKFIADMNEISEKEILDKTKVVFQYMDINFFLSGSGHVICPSEKFRSPLIQARTDSDVLMEYTFAYKANEGDSGAELYWETKTPTEFVVIRSAESLFWNRRGLRMKNGDTFEAKKVDGFDRTRLLLAHGSIELNGQVFKAPQVFPVNDKIEVKSLEMSTALALVWI